MIHYRYDSAELPLAISALFWAAAAALRLGVPAPNIRWFRKASAADHDWSTTGPVLGLFSPSAATEIRVSADQGRTAARHTVLHEIGHFAQHQLGLESSTKASRERDAELFARSQTAIVSTGKVARDGTRLCPPGGGHRCPHAKERHSMQATSAPLAGQESRCRCRTQIQEMSNAAIAAGDMAHTPLDGESTAASAIDFLKLRRLRFISHHDHRSPFTSA